MCDELRPAFESFLFRFKDSFLAMDFLVRDFDYKDMECILSLDGPAEEELLLRLYRESLLPLRNRDLLSLASRSGLHRIGAGKYRKLAKYCKEKNITAC